MLCKIKVVFINIIVFIVLILLLESALRLSNYAPSDVLRPVYCPNLMGDYLPSQSGKVSFSKALHNSFSTDSQGFRSLHEYPWIKGKKTVRILCLGDSFTLGFGVDNQYTYPELLKQALGRRYPGIKFEVYNAGWLLSNILDHMDYYYEKGRRLRPDIVILQFYINDIFSDMNRPFVYRTYFRGKQDDCDYVGIISRFKNSAIFNAAAKLYTKFKKDNYFSKQDSTGDPLAHWLVQPDAEESGYMGPIPCSNEENIPYTSRVWNSYKGALASFTADIVKDGAVPLFFVAPFEEQLRQDYNAPYCSFASVAKKIGLGFVDITREFRLFDRGHHDDLYIPNDEHANPVGNTIIAETIASCLSFEEEEGAIRSKFKELFPLRSCEKRVFRIYKSTGSYFVDARKGAGSIASIFYSEAGMVSPSVAGKKDFVFVERDDSYKGGAGHIFFDVRLEEPAQLMHVMIYWRLFHDLAGKSRIVAVVKGDGEEHVLMDLSSNKSGEWDSYEIRKVLECNFKRPVKSFSVDLYFYGKSGILMSTSEKSSQERSLEFSLYNQE